MKMHLRIKNSFVYIEIDIAAHYLIYNSFIMKNHELSSLINVRVSKLWCNLFASDVSPMKAPITRI